MAEEKLQHAAVPMGDIAAGVRGLRIGFVNVFGVENPDRSWVLIDAGLPFSATLIKKWAERNFNGPPKALILTHGHFDHVSGAAELASEWKMPIYAHSLEFPYLTGQKEYPPPKAGAGGGLMSTLSPIYPRGPVNLDEWLQPLLSSQEGKRLNELPQWEVVYTPGHTPGHISLFRHSDQALLVGDAFCTTKPESFFEAAIAQSTELHGPPAYFTADPHQAAQSITKLVKLAPRIVAPGHGHPLAGSELKEKLPMFAAEFAEEVKVGEMH